MCPPLQQAHARTDSSPKTVRPNRASMWSLLAWALPVSVLRLLFVACCCFGVYSLGGAGRPLTRILSTLSTLSTLRMSTSTHTHSPCCAAPARPAPAGAHRAASLAPVPPAQFQRRLIPPSYAARCGAQLERAVRFPPSGAGNARRLRACVARGTSRAQCSALTLLEGLLELGELGKVGELARTQTQEERRQ